MAIKHKNDRIDSRVKDSKIKQWKAFYDALDRPAREIPKLKKLFTKPSIWK